MNGKTCTLSLTIAALISLGAASALAEGLDTMLALGDDLEISVQLNAGTDADAATLITAPGSYVEGTLESDGADLDLLLETIDGKQVRRLMSGVAHRGVFRFVAGAAEYRLRLSARSGAGRITILRNLPRAEQLDHPSVLVDETPLSPTLQNLLAAEDPAHAIDAFWKDRSLEGTPMIEADPSGDPSKRLITFLWRGAQHNARIVGAPADDHIWMVRLADTDIWFASFIVADDLRLSYQIAPDIPLVPGTLREQRAALLATLQADPLNKTPFLANATDTFEQSSLIALENAPEQIGTGQSGYHGLLESRIFESPSLGNRRKLWFFQPDGFDAHNPDAVLLVVYDGKQYLERASALQMLTALSRIPGIPPMATVFVDSIDPQTRWQELSCNDAFLSAMANEVLPTAASHFGLAHNPKRTVIAGSSLGGLSAACLALKHPHSFGNFISMSGSYWWGPDNHKTKNLPFVAAIIKEVRPQNTRAFISAGSYETSRFKNEIGILEGSQVVADTLQSIGLPDVTWQQYEGGHDYAVWRGALADGLVALFGQRAKPTGQAK